MVPEFSCLGQGHNSFVLAMLHGKWDLSPQPGNELVPLLWEYTVLISGQQGSPKATLLRAEVCFETTVF